MAGKTASKKTEKAFKQFLADLSRDRYQEHIDALLDIRKNADAMGISKESVVLVEHLIRRISGIACYRLPDGIPEKAESWCRSCGLPAALPDNTINYHYPKMEKGGCANCGGDDFGDNGECRPCKKMREDV